MINTAHTNDSLAGCRILVVEDDYMIATDLARTLRNGGAEVIGPAASIEAALHLIRITKGLDGALLDVNLGGKMAFPVADALLEHGIRFAFVTGYGQNMIPTRFASISRHEKPLDLRRSMAALFY